MDDSEWCEECGHDLSGVRLAEWVNAERARDGLGPILARCDHVLADHGFGDLEVCECTSPGHATRLRAA